MKLNVYASIENDEDGEFHGTESRQLEVSERDLPVTISLPTYGGVIHVHLEPDPYVKRDAFGNVIPAWAPRFDSKGGKPE